MENELLKQEIVSEETPVEKVGKFKMPGKKTIYIIVALVAAAGGLFYCKGFFVAAMVDGNFISRMSVVKETEKQSGKAVLDSLIVTKLVENKVKDIELSKEELDAAVSEVGGQLTAQGMTMDDFFKSRGITESEFRDHLALQKKLEKFLADKIAVTNEEVAQYAKDNKAMLPKGLEAGALKAQITEALRQEKFNTEVGQLIDSLKTEAKIRYFVEY